MQHWLKRHAGSQMSASDDFTTDRRTTEKTYSAYMQYRWAFDMGTMPSNLRVGLRYEKTDVTSSALVPIATGIQWVGTNEFNVVFADPDFTELKGDYDYWLPNFDFNVEVVENVILRTSYSHTIGRPSWGDIQGGQTLNTSFAIDGGTGNQGDPGLLPLESKNIDFSAEWYYPKAVTCQPAISTKTWITTWEQRRLRRPRLTCRTPGRASGITKRLLQPVLPIPRPFASIFLIPYGDDPAVNITGVGSQRFYHGHHRRTPGRRTRYLPLISWFRLTRIRPKSMAGNLPGSSFSVKLVLV